MSDNIQLGRRYQCILVDVWFCVQNLVTIWLSVAKHQWNYSNLESYLHPTKVDLAELCCSFA